MCNSYNYRIYLDACCLNRPFDDQTQSRIALETQAILTILSQCQSGIWRLIASAALDAELDQTPDLERLKNVKKYSRSLKSKSSAANSSKSDRQNSKAWDFLAMMPLISQVVKEAKPTFSSRQTIDSSKKPRKTLN
ncbi:hypothetical protein [Nostoc sp. T09]|uniref:hypothetical protein n=1 Tax=Nostoc sp. T09 TaxID=1932621 RepID=UPI00211AFA95|nr:hypothetical protein [Nostoc sp. T09]